MSLSISVFLITLAATFFAAYLGRRHSKSRDVSALKDEKLNRWLVGLSAGATANSGFIVTGAVALGYSFGLQWLLLPLGWLMGDILFWRFFPQRINAFGHATSANTISQMIGHGHEGQTANLLRRVVSIAVLLGLTGYLCAQFLAGQKFLLGAFELPPIVAMMLFAILIVGYSALGGFRGSVYADSFQAIIRIIGTVIALILVVQIARETPEFATNIDAAGPEFLNLLGTLGAIGALAFALGWSFAAIGFGLGQPQIISRYLAGESPKETQSAWLTYILFVQGTWIAMTLFGVILRGVSPGIADPEAGFAEFFSSNAPGILSGIIFADIFATIAATSNSILVVMGQTLVQDFLPRRFRSSLRVLTWSVLGVGVVAMTLSFFLPGTVVTIALTSVSLLAAAVAPSVIARICNWPVSVTAMLISLGSGFGSAILWRTLGYNSVINEAAPGIAVGLCVVLFLSQKSPQLSYRESKPQ